MFSKGQTISGMVFNTIMILVISKLATNSLNPMEVFRGDSLLLKVVVGFLCFTLLLGIIQMLFRGRLENKSCSKCARSLVKFAGAYGNPLRCTFCGQWYHNNCFKADGGSMLGGCRQSHCASAHNQYE